VGEQWKANSQYVSKAKRFSDDSDKTTLLALEFLSLDKEKELEMMQKDKEMEMERAYLRQCMSAMSQRYNSYIFL
jgi:hypothetical protein